MPKHRDANNGLCAMKCKSSTCIEMDSCEFCKDVADKYLQTLKIIANIEQLLDELTRSAVTEKVKIEGTYSAMLFTVAPLLMGLLGPVKLGDILLAGLQAAAATALATIFMIFVKRFSGKGSKAVNAEELEVDLKSTELEYSDVEELFAALNEFKKLADVYKLILNKCAEECDVKVGKKKNT